jgi:hypothetical protein
LAENFCVNPAACHERHTKVLYCTTYDDLKRDGNGTTATCRCTAVWMRLLGSSRMGASRVRALEAPILPPLALRFEARRGHPSLLDGRWPHRRTGSHAVSAPLRHWRCRIICWLWGSRARGRSSCMLRGQSGVRGTHSGRRRRRVASLDTKPWPRHPQRGASRTRAV